MPNAIIIENNCALSVEVLALVLIPILLFIIKRREPSPKRYGRIKLTAVSNSNPLIKIYRCAARWKHFIGITNKDVAANNYFGGRDAFC
jgi:hypothetical protein